MEVDMTRTEAQINKKISVILCKFLNKNFTVHRSLYLDCFLEQLIKKNFVSEATRSQFVDWLVECSKLWSNKKVSPSNAILCFTLNVASHLSLDEQIFIKLNCQNVYETLSALAQANFNKDIKIVLGFVSLLCSFLEHKTGVQWVLATTYWTNVIDLAKEANSVHIKEKSYIFVAYLLEKTVSFNRAFCGNLISTILEPLKKAFESVTVCASGQQVEVENQTFVSLAASVSFISGVVNILLKDMQLNILNLFHESEIHIYGRKLVTLSQSEDLSYELLKLGTILMFSKINATSGPIKIGGNDPHCDSFTLFDMKNMYDVIEGEMEKDHVRCIIKSTHYAHKLYCTLSIKMPASLKKIVTEEFQSQMMVFQIMPLLMFCSQTGIERQVVLGDVFRRNFIQKILKLSAARTVEICYKWKCRLAQKTDLIEDATFGLQYIIYSKKFLNKEMAAIFFQPLVYALKDTLTVMEAEGAERFQKEPSYNIFFYTLIEGIIDLVKSFNLTWSDSIETICVLRIAFELLKYSHWEEKIVISGLKLLNLALSKYMSPDMILLMENSKDSIVSQTGTLLYSKCNDSSWEIRDSALETIYTLSSNAISKFPSFTNILLEAELPQLVVKMALNDSESYVRATAFRCLHELIQIEDVWKELLQMDKLLDNLLAILEHETEGLVRKEAATLIHKIDKFQGFPIELMPRVYDIMSHAVVGDLHWEVKCSGLEFWIHLVELHLNHQGMIDKEFPAVTFSKEHRKIVTLTEPEIRKRIIKALNQLSHTGCLYVLKSACLDDCDVEVSKAAAQATSFLLNLLKTYKVPCTNVDMKEPPSPINLYSIASPLANSSATCTGSSPDCSPFNISEPLTPFSPIETVDLTSPLPNDLTSNNEMVYEEATDSFDTLVDELLKSDDVTILQGMARNSDVKNDVSEIHRKRNYLEPSEFIKFVYNYQLTQEERVKAASPVGEEEFESLLDDILKGCDNGINKIIHMDCY